MNDERRTPSLDGTIVVGVDGSASSSAALRWASLVSDRTGQALRALHAQVASGTATDVGDLTGGVAVDVEHIDGAPSAVLADASTAEDTSMVVVGARGLGAVRGRLLGSVGRHCVRQSARPVIVVHGEPVTTPSRIVVGVDGTAHSEQALRWAIELALALDAEVIAVHAVGSEVIAAAGIHLRPRFHDEWCQPLRDAGVRHREVFATGKARDELLSVAAETEADLLVVGTRYDQQERRLVLGSLATHLCERARIPLAVVRHRR